MFSDVCFGKLRDNFEGVPSKCGVMTKSEERIRFEESLRSNNVVGLFEVGNETTVLETLQLKFV